MEKKGFKLFLNELRLNLRLNKKEIRCVDPPRLSFQEKKKKLLLFFFCLSLSLSLHPSLSLSLSLSPSLSLSLSLWVNKCTCYRLYSFFSLFFLSSNKRFSLHRNKSKFFVKKRREMAKLICTYLKDKWVIYETKVNEQHCEEKNGRLLAETKFSKHGTMKRAKKFDVRLVKIFVQNFNM